MARALSAGPLGPRSARAAKIGAARHETPRPREGPQSGHSGAPDASPPRRGYFFANAATVSVSSASNASGFSRIRKWPVPGSTRSW